MNFLTMAHGSIAEVQSHLYVALDEEYISKQEFQNLHAKADEASRMIQGFSNYLKKL